MDVVAGSRVLLVLERSTPHAVLLNVHRHAPASRLRSRPPQPLHILPSLMTSSSAHRGRLVDLQEQQKLAPSSAPWPTALEQVARTRTGRPVDARPVLALYGRQRRAQLRKAHAPRRAAL